MDVDQRQDPRPPEIAAAPPPRVRDWIRGTGWLGRMYVHELKKSRGVVAKTAATVQLGGYGISSPILLGLAPVVPWLKRKSTRYYMTPARDARLGITAKADGWHFADHLSSRPGEKKGEALRDLIRGPLLAEADRLGVVIHLTAANDKVAGIYNRELPGLVDVGRGFPRGRRLERRPGATPQPAVATGPAAAAPSEAQQAPAPSGPPESDVARLRRLRAASFPHSPQAAVTQRPGLLPGERSYIERQRALEQRGGTDGIER